MKHLISILVAFMLIVPISVRSDDENVPEVSAEAFVLYCVNNSQIVLSSNAHKKLGMASTTKIMTSLLALEASREEDRVVTFTEDMMAEGSSMYLKAGDKVRLSDLSAGMMTVSGNDAANAVALTLSKSFEEFSSLMNKRASEIGMKNTNFVTPSGLSDENHYSTAYDMALLIQEAMACEEFALLTSKKSVEVNFINPENQKITYSNHNRLLSLYPYCTGGKTGYTKSTGRCLVTYSEREGLSFICVTLNDRDDWNDHKVLYDYGFSRYSLLSPESNAFFVEVIGGETELVSAKGTSNSVVLKNEEKERMVKSIYLSPCVFAPVKEGDCVGKILYTLDSQVICEDDLFATCSVERQKLNIITRTVRRLLG